jgi:hypothetical protein
MAPSKRQGAVMPQQRRPAISVVIFECPCGTGANKRSPRAARRRRRVTSLPGAPRKKNDRAHGVQFRASFLKATEPTTLAGIEQYLASGMIA